MRTTAALLIATLLTLAPPPAAAHPHVWVEIKTRVLYDDGGRVTGLRHSWLFDEFYSSFAVQGLDKDGDGTYTRGELDELAKINVESLSEFDYFTFARAGEVDTPFRAPTDYWLDHDEEGRLTLHFTLPLADAVRVTDTKLAYQVYDPTYYIAFTHAEQTPLAVSGNAPSHCGPVLEQPVEETTSVDNLSEAFFEALNKTSDFGAKYAAMITVSCRG